MTLPKLGVILPIAGIAALALFLTRHCGPTPDPSKPYREELARMAHQHSLDSAEAANAYEVKRREADSLGKVAAVSFHNAQRYQRVADSLGRIPRYRPPVVPVTPCDSALAVTVMERDTLRSALDTMTAAYEYRGHVLRQDVEAMSILYTQLMKSEGLRSQTNALMEDERQAWRSTVARLKPCKVLGLIGCPTLAVGYGVALYQGRVISVPTATVGIPVKLW